MPEETNKERFTKVDNRVLESIQMFKFTTNQLKIVLAVWRYTFGFHRESHEMSLSFLQKATYLDHKSVSRSLKELIKKRVIFEIQKGGGNKSKIISFNKNHDEWEIEKYSLAIAVEGSGQNATTGSVKLPPTGSGQNATKERKVKESIKKKRYMDLSIHGNEFLDLYLNYFNQRFQKQHMRVSEENSSFILNQLEIVQEQADIEEFEEIVRYHFEYLPANNDGSILPFLLAVPRYLKMFQSEEI